MANKGSFQYIGNILKYFFKKRLGRFSLTQYLVIH